MLRRPASPHDQDVITVGDVRIDVRGRRISVGDKLVELTAREFDLLAALAATPGTALSRADLLASVWGYDFPVRTKVVDVFVGYLRRKLEEDGHPRIVHTVRGFGFVLRSDE